jgi:hypothetical protein
MKRKSTLAEGDRALERNGRRGKENHDEIQLESEDVCQSGGNLVVNVDEKTDSALGELTSLWPTLPAEVRTAIVLICRATRHGDIPVGTAPVSHDSSGCRSPG